MAKFCNVGGMLSAAASSITRVQTRRKKCREFLPLLASRVFSHSLKAKIYEAYFRSAMLSGSETPPVKRENNCKLQRIEIQKTKWMYNILSN